MEKDILLFRISPQIDCNLASSLFTLFFLVSDPGQEVFMDLMRPVPAGFGILIFFYDNLTPRSMALRRLGLWFRDKVLPESTISTYKAIAISPLPKKNIPAHNAVPPVSRGSRCRSILRLPSSICVVDICQLLQQHPELFKLRLDI